MPFLKSVSLVPLLIKIFCLGLLLHFLLYTFVTFARGVDAGPLWAWKELVIFWLTGIISVVMFQKKLFKDIIRQRRFLIVSGAFLLGIFLTLTIHVIMIQTPITRWMMAMRYDYLGFFLLLLWRLISYILPTEKSHQLISRYGRVMKRVLCLAIVRWCIVAIKPGTIKLFGYNNYVFEGTVGMQPPAVYYTHINYGLPRSQFLFERPTTYGFRLTAFFPLFFFWFLKGRRRQDTRARRTIYGTNILLTFSRAARWSRIVIVVVLIALTTQISWRRLFWRYGIPLVIIFGSILVLWREQIALRGYSNYGHMTMIKQWWTMFLSSPWRWVGSATAGPGSHRLDGGAFNPENQFLQILIEFGVIGSLPRLFLRWRSVWIGFSRKIWWLLAKEILLAFSLGILTLTISGMVLHSFGDRMVVYPFMLLFWLAIGNIYRPVSKA